MSGASATVDMCAAAFGVIEHALGLTPVAPPKLSEAGTAPVFVCFKTNDGSLRGCIGTFTTGSLATQVPKYASQAAFRDSRFKPLRREELSGLQCTVSTLHSFEKARQWDAWCVGEHGVRIRGEYHGELFSATFLPKVAAEQGWDQRETMLNLLDKAGVPPREDMFPSLFVERYQHSEASMSYEEYRSSTGRPLPSAATTCATC
jgi:uncharacterized protein (TIGR00296 family)